MRPPHGPNAIISGSGGFAASWPPFWPRPCAIGPRPPSWIAAAARATTSRCYGNSGRRSASISPGQAWHYAHGQGEQAIAQATATHLPFADARFDVVTSFDVIYALEDEAEGAALREMFRVLRPGGYLVLNAAAMDLLKGNHSVLANEVRRYSRATLTERLTRTGFDVRRMSYTNATILPAVAVVRLLQRLSGHEESQQEIAIPPAPINAALTAALAVEAALLRVVNMPFGTSLMALAQKPNTDH